MNSEVQERPVIVHIVFKLDYGGLENGLVNLVNQMDDRAFRHIIVALTEATGFRDRITRADVTVYSMAKRPGKDFATYWRIFRLLRKIRPTIVHTRNIGTLDCVLLARLAGVSVCFHGEHGWDVHDPEGKSKKYQVIRRVLGPLITHFITVSRELEEWLVKEVGIRSEKVVRICNGVDVRKFRPRDSNDPENPGLFARGAIVVGSVLRFQSIKDPMNLAKAFVLARSKLADATDNLCLLMVGDGPLRQPVIDMLDQAAIPRDSWKLPGASDDVPAMLRTMDVFVLGSRREGVSNTLLEAMATGLPVVATATGGNLELVRDGENGVLVPPESSDAIASEVLRYCASTSDRHRHGAASRHLALREYSIAEMVDAYMSAYQSALR